MPYQVIEPLINPADITPLGLGLSSFTPIYLTTDQAFENLKTLLLTKKGERYHQPTFGTRLLYVLFEPNTELIKEQIETIITQPVSFWLPYITIEDIDIVTAEENPDLYYNIQITISFSVAQYSTQTITFGVTDTGLLEVS
jgi:phage baseplate assembly protein W